MTDPADPTPYVYLSTRSPQRLAEALAAGREAADGREREARDAGREPAAPAQQAAGQERTAG